MKNTSKKELIKKELIKHGNNQKDVEKMVQANYEYVVRVYKNTPIRELAEIIRTIA